MKLDRTQLASILNVKLSGLKTIERRNQLNDRLKENGYKLIKKIKEGKKSFYIAEKLYNNQDKKVYNNLCRYVYNTNRPDQFGLFFNIRTENNNKAFTNKEIADIANIGVKSITKWNNCLLDKGIIVKDGFFYFYIDNVDRQMKACSKEAYKNFWKNKYNSEKRDKLQEEYLNGKITLDEVIRKSEDNGAARFYIEGRYYYRVKKYKTNTDNKLYVSTKELIDVLNIDRVSQLP